jgi:hypothetical protein
VEKLLITDLSKVFFVDRALSKSVTCYDLLEPRTGLKKRTKIELREMGAWLS